MTTSSSGSVKWSQVSEDLVPVNISAITEAGTAPRGSGGRDNNTDGAADRQAQLQQPRGEKGQQVIFHVTAYNSQVEKILDVRLVQPGRTVATKLSL